MGKKARGGIVPDGLRLKAKSIIEFSINSLICERLELIPGRSSGLKKLGKGFEAGEKAVATADLCQLCISRYLVFILKLFTDSLSC